jgi:hypothetical protein
VSLLFAHGRELISVLFGAALTAATMIAAGRLLMRGLGVKCCRGEEDALAFVVGGACLSQAVFLLCTAGLASAAAFGIVSAGSLAAAFWCGARRRAAPVLPPLARPWRLLFLSIFPVFFVLYLVHAMAPEMSPDGSTYHLGLPARYLREGGFRPVATNFYASFPQAVEMLFLFAFAFGRHSAAAMIHFGFTLSLAALLLFYGRRFQLGAAGACAALLVFVSPVVGKDGTSAYIDVAVACASFAVFYLLQMWRREKAPGLLALAGLCAGFAFAAKYTGCAALAYAAAVVLLGPKRRLKQVAIVCGCAALLILPWLLKNWVEVRNPFSPFLNSLFPNPYVQPSFEREYRAYFRHYGLTSLWQLPLEVTARGAALNGMIGPVFLLSPLALAAARCSQGRQILLAALFFALPYPGNIGARFLIPCLPFLALALSMALARFPAAAAAVAAVHAVLSFPLVARTYSAPHSWIVDRFPVKAALRLEREDAYLAREFPPYALARMIERRVPAGASVFTFRDVAYAYTSRDIRVAYQSASNFVLADILWTPLAPRFQPDTSLRFRIAPLLLRGLRIVQLSGDPNREWSIAEIQVGGGPPRTAKITAQPNAWEAELAMDRSLATRWRAREPAKPGMFLELDFGRGAVVSEVRVDCAGSAENTHDVKLLGREGAGGWRELGRPVIVPAPLAADLRAQAIREMKRRGVGYMLVFEEDLFADDYSDNAREWGLTLVEQLNNARLYRLR